MGTRRSTDEARLTGATWAVQGAGLSTIERRLHDAVDLAGGRITTAPVARTLTAATRVTRLARLGFGADPSIFGGPTYRLTPRAPYQPAPEAWLDAYDGTYSTGPGVDQIWWRLPPTFPQFTPGCNFTFSDLPPGPAVMTLVLEAWPHGGATGELVIDIGARRTEIEISMPVARTVDIGFVHDGDERLVTMVLFRQGLLDVVFRSVSLAGGLILLDPT